jgi:putative methionine-R-sulfoxide reductase with GAF domain
VTEPNSFENPEYLKDLELINKRLTTPGPSKSQATSDATKLADALAEHSRGEESSSSQELEQACLATGATGAAIALVQGDEIVCQAAAGPHAPDVGVRLDPRAGLSGACIRTRQVQQCNDTQTDPRVDAEACRRLGVRSIVVLPLMKGDDLFGIFEVLSSRPNAFGQRDLDILQFLAHRIVENRRQDWQAAAPGPRKEPATLPLKVEEVIRGEKSPAQIFPAHTFQSPIFQAQPSQPSTFQFQTSQPQTSQPQTLRSAEPVPEVPRPERKYRRKDLKTTALNALVIAAAMLLGTLVGWRLGWQKATVGVHASSTHYRAGAPSKNGLTENAVLPAKELEASSAGTDECGESAATAFSTQPPSGGLMVCQGGQVIFRLPPSTPLPARDLKTLQRSPASKAGPKGR